MAGRGPAPKDPEKRRRRNTETRTSIDRGARLPRSQTPALGNRPGGGAWQPETKAWWDEWRDSPQATRFVGTDWQLLRRLAPLVDAYWVDVKAGAMSAAKELLAEIRLQESKVGAAADDRARLKWDLVANDPAANASRADEVAAKRAEREKRLAAKRTPAAATT